MGRSPTRGRAPYTRPLAWIAGAVLVGVAAVGVSRAPVMTNRLLLAVAERAPADPACAGRLGQLAALLGGVPLAEGPCDTPLAGSPLYAGALAHAVRDKDRALPVREAALRALGSAAPPGLTQALVLGPATPPDLRRSAIRVAMDAAAEAGARTAADWVDRGGAAALHGLYDRALARRFADAEPDTTWAIWRALGASSPAAVDPAVRADAYVGLGIDAEELERGAARHAAGQLPLGLPTDWWPVFWWAGCTPDCMPLLRGVLAVEARRRGEADPAAPATVPGADAALDVLYAEDGATADHIREELAAVAAWLGAVSESRRAARLVGAVLHPRATPLDAVTASHEAGDPHAVLARGAGSPGATALVATDLALAARVPAAVWVTPAGVAVQVGGRVVEVETCEVPRAATRLPAWREVPLGGVDALAFVEGAARSLRRGDVAGARRAIDAARTAWPDAPGLGPVDAAVLAREGAPTAADATATAGLPAPVAEPVRRRSRRRAAAPPTPPAAPGVAPVLVGGLLGLPAGDALLVSRPFVPSGRRGAPSPPRDGRVDARARLVAHVARVVALAPDAADRIRAAWWAAAGGHRDLARALLLEAGDPGALPSTLLPLRDAVQRATGEPVRVGAAPTPPEAIPCPEAFRANPPVSAWSGAAPGAEPAPEAHPARPERAP